MSFAQAQGTLSSLTVMGQWGAALAGLGAYREAADGLDVARQLAPIVEEAGNTPLAALLQTAGASAFVEQSSAQRTSLLEQLEGRIPDDLLRQAQADAVRLRQLPGTTRPLKVVALGDVHGKWNKVQQLLDHEFPLGHGMALCVGDLVSFPRLEHGHRIFFITGNHDRFSVMGSIRDGTHPAARHYTYLKNGSIQRFGGLTSTGLSGVHSPHFFDQPDDCPPMYFSSRDLEAARSVPFPIDILLMHDSPHGIGFKKKEGELGNFLLRGLVEYLKPRLVLFGHHHKAFEGQLGETQILGLDHPWRSYATILFDPATQGMQIERHIAQIPEGRQAVLGYQYPWEHGTDSPETLFGSIMLQKRERIEKLLREKHRTPLRDKIQAELLERVTGDTEAQRNLRAETRAGLAVNGALPYATEYLDALERNPHLTQEEKRQILEGIYQRMCGTLVPDASTDLVRAFQGYLQAVGVVLS